MKAKQHRNLFSRVCSSLRDLFTRSWQRRQTERRARPFLECLESRITPATFTDSGRQLLITLTANNEQVAISCQNNATSDLTINDNGNTFTNNTTQGQVALNTSTNATVTGNFYTQGIRIVDAPGVSGASVAFENGSGTIQVPIAVSLGIASGNISFDGGTVATAANFSASTAGGTIESFGGNTLSVSANLSLSASAAAGEGIRSGRLCLCVRHDHPDPHRHRDRRDHGDQRQQLLHGSGEPDDPGRQRQPGR